MSMTVFIIFLVILACILTFCGVWLSKQNKATKKNQNNVHHKKHKKR